ncbi:hypothetical protein PGTUg99_014374 [Puccinia graminis f. sp. tritici]|uniref:Uncharacterized protein n=1 Tax=Puccinia graminis f. sp. tritici TaxID=56615 RepID=A0A5B0SLP5_PUCGR|nr:hypothetical protein PGTUg99_014374 [Puccinia graminis f. sp. tritici]
MAGAFHVSRSIFLQSLIRSTARPPQLSDRAVFLSYHFCGASYQDGKKLAPGSMAFGSRAGDTVSPSCLPLRLVRARSQSFIVQYLRVAGASWPISTTTFFGKGKAHPQMNQAPCERSEKLCSTQFLHQLGSDANGSDVNARTPPASPNFDLPVNRLGKYYTRTFDFENYAEVRDLLFGAILGAPQPGYHIDEDQ